MNPESFLSNFRGSYHMPDFLFFAFLISDALAFYLL